MPSSIPKDIWLPLRDAMKELVEQIRKALAGCRLTFGDELGLQDELADVFKLSGIDFVRECILTPQDRADFFVPVTGQGYAIEVKVGGSIHAHLRQVRRYNENPAVMGTILIATRPFAVPPTLSGKPVACINVGGNRL